MDYLDFKNECCNYICNCLEQYKNYKEIMIDILNIFISVCEKNDIKYYASFGTLLGIVRDNGIIPWDADIDVMIPSSEISKTISALKEDLPEDYYFVSNFIDNTYPFCQIRVCKKGYNSFNYHLDVFYMIGYPSNPKKQKKFDASMMKLFYKRLARYEKIEKASSIREKIINSLKKIRRFWLKITPSTIFERKCRKLIFKYDFTNSLYFTIFCHANYKFEKKILEPNMISKINNVRCCIPNDSKTLLDIIYYKNTSYLDISKRFNEFYFSYLRISGNKKGDL